MRKIWLITSPVYTSPKSKLVCGMTALGASRTSLAAGSIGRTSVTLLSVKIARHKTTMLISTNRTIFIFLLLRRLTLSVVHSDGLRNAIAPAAIVIDAVDAGLVP